MPEQKWMPSQALLDTFCEIVGTENVSVGEPMAAHVTFRIGGPAAVMVSPQSPEQVAEVVRDLWRRDQERGLSAGEKRMLAKARQILVGELALAENTDDAKASTILDEVLAAAS